MIKRNKRGDVPITILVIGVFALCSLAMLTFFMADFKMGNSFVGVSVMQKMDSTIDEYNFHLNAGVSKESLINSFETIEFGEKTYLYYSKNKARYLGLVEGDQLAFSVRYPIS